ncbi:rapamycin-insensitive companion of mTOR [Anthonomus grandis grandis]|uniref:rapamycin-insensitive companion of mTOR n=1 Tax=Anthonomus grandis grandis TaxID=2921223 RepID=UPI002164FF61|nr:rapamycin-insensitive companion of mTOR [Anthonomus grandis grandis]
MALSSWILRSQMGHQSRRFNFRSGNRNKDQEEDLFSSCKKQEPHECFKNILSKFCEIESEEKDLLNYLNTFVKLLDYYKENFDEVNFSRREILLCLRLPLMNESSIVRSAGLRCIRHTIQNSVDVSNINHHLIPFFVMRSLDLKNDVERVEAMKLIRKMIHIAPKKCDISLARSLVSIANGAPEGKDRLLRICLATLSELGLFNPTLLIESGGVNAITRNLIDCQIPLIAESLCGVLLLLLDRPETRNIAKIDLHCVAAPFSEFNYKHGWKDKTRDERKLRLNCSRLILLTVLKSWPGLLHFCSPKDTEGFRSIVDVLYLQQREVRKAVLDLLYDLLGLQQPEWTEELSVALSAIDPCELQSSWRLKEGFVAAEGKSILPHLAKTTPSPTEMHLALLLMCFLECGILPALTEVITSSDTFISVRATVLLSELLRLIQLYLPPGCCNVSPSLPKLIEYATKSKPQAMGAITALQQLHKLMRKRPASYSLHLDYVIRNNSTSKNKMRQERHTRNKRLKSKLNQVKAALKDGDDIVKETGVLSSKEAKMWNWGVIKMILKGDRGQKLDLSDSTHKIFLKRLLDFFTPSQNKYSHMDLGITPSDSLELTTSGIEFIKYLGEVKDPECQLMVLHLFEDIHAQIKSISTSRSVHDCLFSPAHMANTHCQSYFLFIGQFARTEAGRNILNSIKMFSLLQELATTTSHDSYTKLIISSLDYSTHGPARELLAAVLTCGVESSRMYATQFMLVLLRSGCPGFSSWAVGLLCLQLEDQSRKVCLSALSTLQEACELPDCLETLTDLAPNMEKLGEKGEILAIRVLSSEKGYNKYGEEMILNVVTRWVTHMNYRYVKIVEGDLYDSLTLHQRNEDGLYDRRVSNLTGVKNNYRKDVILQPHLYGQLNQHAEGFQLLTRNGFVTSMVELIQKAPCSTDEQILKLKAALWAVGHLSTSNIGFTYLNALEFVKSMIQIATKCPVYGVRSTAFYALGLVATTSLGADELCLNGWLATRHNRHENWPVIQEELMDSLCISYFTTSVWEDAPDTSKEEDEVTLSEEDERLTEYPASPAFSPDIRKVKQWTLPVTRTPPDFSHHRSLSESKTFDSATSNGFGEVGPYALAIGRQRNSSMTESTTSGVSSCDSLPNRQGGPAYLRTLSPIPSSTSLSILKMPPPPPERRAHRISSNSAGSDASTSSLSAAGNELSLQNMLGYQTIRYIRRRDSLNFHRTERDDYLFRPPPQTSRKSLGSETIHAEPTATIHYASLFAQNFDPIYEPLLNYKPKDTIYRGICLPRIVTDLFPTEPMSYPREVLVPEDALPKVELNLLNVVTEKAKSQIWAHSKDRCVLCSQNLTPLLQHFENDPLKTEVLRITERLANPVLTKPFINQLLRLKQKDPIIFNDVCLYSEVCKIFSECSYSLAVRRIIHELFLDVGYEKCFEIPRKILLLDNKPKASGRKSTGDIVTLDSLKLISAENKFPIRTRKNTN